MVSSRLHSEGMKLTREQSAAPFAYFNATCLLDPSSDQSVQGNETVYDRRLCLQTQHPCSERVLPPASAHLWARTKCQSRMKFFSFFLRTSTVPFQSLLSLSSLLGALPAVRGCGAGTTKAKAVAAVAAMARSRARGSFLSNFRSVVTIGASILFDTYEYQPQCRLHGALPG